MPVILALRPCLISSSRCTIPLLLVTGTGFAAVDSWTDAGIDADDERWDGPPEIVPLELPPDPYWDTGRDPSADLDADEHVVVEDSHDISSEDPGITDISHEEPSVDPMTDTPSDTGHDPGLDPPVDTVEEHVDDAPPSGEIVIEHSCGCSLVG